MVDRTEIRELLLMYESIIDISEEDEFDDLILTLEELFKKNEVDSKNEIIRR